MDPVRLGKTQVFRGVTEILSMKTVVDTCPGCHRGPVCISGVSGTILKYSVSPTADMRRLPRHFPGKGSQSVNNYLARHHFLFVIMA